MMPSDATPRAFRGSDDKSALAAARAALGPDVELVEVRKVPGPPGARPLVEVVVIDRTGGAVGGPVRVDPAPVAPPSAPVRAPVAAATGGPRTVGEATAVYAHVARTGGPPPAGSDPSSHPTAVRGGQSVRPVQFPSAGTAPAHSRLDPATAAQLVAQQGRLMEDRRVWESAQQSLAHTPPVARPPVVSGAVDAPELVEPRGVRERMLATRTPDPTSSDPSLGGAAAPAASVNQLTEPSPRRVAATDVSSSITVAPALVSGQGAAEPPPASRVYEQMVERGVDPGLARELVRRALAAGASDLIQLEQATRQMGALQLAAAPPPWMSGGEQRRVIALVGPTGVGKTTTLAKLAARALLESRLRVALITVDTYRICASDQLARYGQIMRVPTYVARDASQLLRALELVQDAQLVLIDSAGRSTREDIERQAQLLRVVPGLEMYLTLSVASGARELAASADRYRFLNPDRLILTKIDEAVSPGGALSAVVRLGKPVTCITNGQRVPEDVHAVTTAQLVNFVLGPSMSRSP